MIFAEVFPCSGVVVSIKEKVESTLLECFHPGEVKPMCHGGAYAQTHIGTIETGSWIANVLRAMFLF